MPPEPTCPHAGHDDLVVSAAAFAAGNPDATTAEFRHWVSMVRAVERYPELLGIAVVRVVEPDEVADYAEQVRADPDLDLAPDEELEVVPPGERDLHCFLQAVGHRAPGAPDLPPGYDYCAQPSLAALVVPTRMSAVSAYQTGVEVYGEMPLIITTPVYEGGVDPGTPAARHRAGFGGIATVIDVQGLLARARAGRTVPAAMFVDLDGFKEVNDTLGHGVGDELLVAASERLVAALRDTDTIGRLGGDEFIVLVDGDTGVDPVAVAERLLDARREPFRVGDDGVEVRVTASVGLATGLRDGPDELLRDADLALYVAKAAGRDRWRRFEAGTALVDADGGRREQGDRRRR